MSCGEIRMPATTRGPNAPLSRRPVNLAVGLLQGAKELGHRLDIVFAQVLDRLHAQLAVGLDAFLDRLRYLGIAELRLRDTQIIDVELLAHHGIAFAGGTVAF